MKPPDVSIAPSLLFTMKSDAWDAATANNVVLIKPSP